VDSRAYEKVTIWKRGKEGRNEFNEGHGKCCRVIAKKVNQSHPILFNGPRMAQRYPLWPLSLLFWLRIPINAV
jgi:hypothetical protein